MENITTTEKDLWDIIELDLGEVSNFEIIPNQVQCDSIIQALC